MPVLSAVLLIWYTLTTKLQLCSYWCLSSWQPKYPDPNKLHPKYLISLSWLLRTGYLELHTVYGLPGGLSRTVFISLHLAHSLPGCPSRICELLSPLIKLFQMKWLCLCVVILMIQPSVVCLVSDRPWFSCRWTKVLAWWVYALSLNATVGKTRLIVNDWFHFVDKWGAMVATISRVALSLVVKSTICCSPQC